MREEELNAQGHLSLQASPLKWIVNPADLPEAGGGREFSADERELRLLSKRLGAELNLNDGTLDLQISHFHCFCELYPHKLHRAVNEQGLLIHGRNMEVWRGHFRLQVKYKTTCVVSLELFEVALDEQLVQDFIRVDSYSLREAPQDRECLDPLAEEEPPIDFAKGRIEIGPFLFQTLSLLIDPNPRKDGVCLSESDREGGLPDDEEKYGASPFAVLKDFGREE